MSSRPAMSVEHDSLSDARTAPSRALFGLRSLFETLHGMPSKKLILDFSETARYHSEFFCEVAEVYSHSSTHLAFVYKLGTSMLALNKLQ